MGEQLHPPAGWYGDPAGSGRQRYFDGVQWTDQYAQTYTTVYAAPTPVDPTPKPAGWYPDPSGGKGRRYWDGARWTGHQAEQEIETPGIPRSVVVTVGLVLALALAASFLEGAQNGDFEALLGTVPVAVVFGLLGWGIWLAFRSDKRRKQRQQEQDRNRALAINAEIEDAAYIRGDDMRGIYGQFPLPPPLRDEKDR